MSELNVGLFCFRSLAEMAATTSVHVVSIIELILQHANWFFPEGKIDMVPLSQTCIPKIAA